MGRLSVWPRVIVSGVAIVVMAAIAIAPARASSPGTPPLAMVRSWHYWLQSYDLQRLQALPVDMLVVDYSRSNPAGGAMIPFTEADVRALQVGPDGKRRIVLAYLSIGEAEEYRFYWDAALREKPPSWYISENCRWPRNHLVKFWERGWKDIIYRASGSYLDRIIDAGFDGIYVDRIDIYDDVKGRHPDPRAEIIAFMTEMSTVAKIKRPGFLVVAQNAEALLSSDSYRQVIDGIAKEDLLHGVGGSGVRNSSALISWSRAHLRRFASEGGAVFAVEYLQSQDAIDAARSELEPDGIVTTFPNRALDGGDPLASPPSDPDGGPQYGTPEYGTSKCDGVFFKNQR